MKHKYFSLFIFLVAVSFGLFLAARPAKADCTYTSSYHAEVSFPAGMTTSMARGTAFPVTMTYKNCGTSTWTAGKEFVKVLVDTYNWGVPDVQLPYNVAPGASVPISYTLYMPADTAGVGTMYGVKTQLQTYGCCGRDGTYSAWWGVNKVNGNRNAAFVSQSVPNPMVAGKVYPVSITMKNTGDVAWGSSVTYSPYPIRLGSQNAPDNVTWGTSRSPQPTTVVGTGAPYTFTFNVTAPATPGNYNFKWAMVHDGVTWFPVTGGVVVGTDNLVISVVNPTPSLSGITMASFVKPDSTTSYDLTLNATDPAGAGNIKDIGAYINYGGSARGYLTWHWPNDNPSWSGQSTCGAGGGYFAKQSDGSGYITLDGCSTSVSGTTRTVTFTVRFNSSFASPVSGNAIYTNLTDGVSGNTTGWQNSGTSFGLVFSPALSSVTPANMVFLTTTPSLSITLNGIKNANKARFYIWSETGGQDDIICPTIGGIAETQTVTSQTFNVSLTGNTKCESTVSQSLVDVGTIYITAKVYNSIEEAAEVTVQYTRAHPGNVNISIPASVGWTLKPPAGWVPTTPPATWQAATADYRGTGPVSLTNVPYGQWTIIPAGRSGYDVQVTPDESPGAPFTQTLGS